MQKTEQHFYDSAQNRTQLHFGEPNNQTINIHKSNKDVTKVKTPHEKD